MGPGPAPAAFTVTVQDSDPAVRRRSHRASGGSSSRNGCSGVVPARPGQVVTVSLVPGLTGRLAGPRRGLRRRSLASWPGPSQRHGTVTSVMFVTVQARDGLILLG